MNCADKTKIARLVSKLLGLGGGSRMLACFHDLITEVSESLDEFETIILSHPGTANAQNCLLILRNLATSSQEIAERYAIIRAKLPFQSKFPAARLDGNVRPDWEHERIALWLRWWNPQIIDQEQIQSLEKTDRHNAHRRYQIALFESLTQDEREDFAYLLIHQTPYHVPFLDGTEKIHLRDLLGQRPHSALRDYMEKHERYQPVGMEGNVSYKAMLYQGVFLSRLDESHALSLGERLLGEIPQPYPEDVFDRAQIVQASLRGLYGLVQFASTRTARETLAAQIPDTLKKQIAAGMSWGEPFSTGSLEGDIHKLVHFWGYGGEHLNNA